MSTKLFAITNTKLLGGETNKEYDIILEKLNALNLETTSYINVEHEMIKEYGDWEYRAGTLDGVTEICFEGPFSYTLHLYTNIGIISTIYGYSLIYHNYSLGWFAQFRYELFKIMTIVGGSEVIYLADNSCDKLAAYLEGMAIENVPYKTIKEKMIVELGLPFTDYRQLIHANLDYRNINCFFLDDFADLKSSSVK